MLKRILQKLLLGEHLTEDQSREVFLSMLGGANSMQAAALLALLNRNGITADELAGFATGARTVAARVNIPGFLLDTCGTGGDGSNSVNLSTAAALVAAACGARVAKHGNRSVTSRCGSADVLEALGIAVDVPTATVIECIEQAGFGFFYAPNYHPALRVMRGIRDGLEVPTIFNCLGPLTNPAPVSAQLLGVGDAEKTGLMANVLCRLGIKRAIVVHGCGLDEISPLGTAVGFELRDGGIQELVIDPTAFGVKRCTNIDLAGGDAATNAALLMNVFAGRESPLSDAVALNAGYALYVAEQAGSPSDGIAMARSALRSGVVLDLVCRLRRLTSAATEPAL